MATYIPPLSRMVFVNSGIINISPSQTATYTPPPGRIASVLVSVSAGTSSSTGAGVSVDGFNVLNAAPGQRASLSFFVSSGQSVFVIATSNGVGKIVYVEFQNIT